MKSYISTGIVWDEKHFILNDTLNEHCRISIFLKILLRLSLRILVGVDCDMFWLDMVAPTKNLH